MTERGPSIECLVGKLKAMNPESSTWEGISKDPNSPCRDCKVPKEVIEQFKGTGCPEGINYVSSLPIGIARKRYVG